MGSLVNVIDFIKQDLYKNKKDCACREFFYSSMLHYSISLEIASSVDYNQPITCEKICEIIPKKFGCKSSIKTVLDNGVYAGFFIKRTTNP